MASSSAAIALVGSCGLGGIVLRFCGVWSASASGALTSSATSVGVLFPLLLVGLGIGPFGVFCRRRVFLRRRRISSSGQVLLDFGNFFTNLILDELVNNLSSRSRIDVHGS